MNASTITPGCDLRKALKVAATLGCTIRHRRGTGELLITHTKLGWPIRICGHRKDCPRFLTSYLARCN